MIVCQNGHLPIITIERGAPFFLVRVNCEKRIRSERWLYRTSGCAVEDKDDGAGEIRYGCGDVR